jgi:hypothetical protein
MAWNWLPLDLEVSSCGIDIFFEGFTGLKGLVKSFLLIFMSAVIFFVFKLRKRKNKK